jgi:hypothetical protein
MLDGSENLFQKRSLKRAIHRENRSEMREKKRNFPVPLRFSWRWCSIDEIMDITLTQGGFNVKKKEGSTTL